MHLTQTDQIIGSKDELNLIDEMKTNMEPPFSPLKGSSFKGDNDDISRKSSENGHGINNSNNPSVLLHGLINAEESPPQDGFNPASTPTSALIKKKKARKFESEERRSFKLAREDLD